MTFIEAVEVVKKKSDWLGKKYNGVVIDEIIIYPTNDISREIFLKNYLFSLDHQKAIVPFRQEDVRVAVLCRKIFLKDNVLLWTDVDKIDESSLEPNYTDL